jgi:hypothetical protein
MFCPHGFKAHKLEIGATYTIGKGRRSKLAKFVRSTRRGFNFQHLQRDIFLYKQHLYPGELNRDGKILTFAFPKDLLIQKV